jgi:AcrR family transcriptional regulator
MAYRRTENVVRRLAEREQTILDAAQSIAAESGMGAVQIAPVAHRADIAAGTVYRYFPSKNNLIAEVIASAAGRELAAMRAAADAAPGPLSALAACIATFAARALNDRRLTWAVLAEPVDANIDTLRVEFRRAIASELAWRISAAITGHHCPIRTRVRPRPPSLGRCLKG